VGSAGYTEVSAGYTEVSAGYTEESAGYTEESAGYTEESARSIEDTVDTDTSGIDILDTEDRQQVFQESPSPPSSVSESQQ
jgi:hypothetical protein